MTFGRICSLCADDHGLMVWWSSINIRTVFSQNFISFNHVFTRWNENFTLSWNAILWKRLLRVYDVKISKTTEILCYHHLSQPRPCTYRKIEPQKLIIVQDTAWLLLQTKLHFWENEFDPKSKFQIINEKENQINDSFEKIISVGMALISIKSDTK